MDFRDKLAHFGTGLPKHEINERNMTLTFTLDANDDDVPEDEEPQDKEFTLGFTYDY